MWKGGGAGGRFRDQWEVVSEGLKGCQKGGIAGRVFLFQHYINYCIVTAIENMFCLFYIDRRRMCKNVLVDGFVV